MNNFAEDEPAGILLEDSNANLRMPQLQSLSIERLLTTSCQLRRQQSLSTMSSVADDSSIADSVSSIGQEEWEKVSPDDDSDAAPDEEISRVPTPQVDVRHLEQTVLVFPTPEQETTNEDGEEDDLYEVGGQDASLIEHTDSIHTAYAKNVDSIQLTLQLSNSSQDHRKSQTAFATIGSISDDNARFSRSSPRSDAPTELHKLVRMDLSAVTLNMARPFKLLYSGNGSIQGAIEAKIGSALVAARNDVDLTNRRQRYSVYPVSWDKDSPEVELMPDSGANMDVETCVGASRFPGFRNHDIDLILQSGQTISSHTSTLPGRYVATKGYQFPDLAIVEVSESEERDQDATATIREFLKRHGVPTIVVTSDEDWPLIKHGIDIDTLTPHFTVQHGTEDLNGLVVRHLPIDVATFLRLNSYQLNRNLSALLPRSAQTGSHTTSPSLYETCYQNLETANIRWSQLAIGLALLLLTTASSSLVHWMVSGPGVNIGPSTRLLSPTYTAMPSTAIDGCTRTESKAIATRSAIGTDVIIKPPKAVTSDFASGHPVLFEAQLHGDSLIIMRPPQWFAELKRAPETIFTVSKDGKSIEHNTSRLHDKVYALSIPREHAHGILDIHITAPKHSKFNQTIRVDMGSAWAKLLDWIKATSELAVSAKETPIKAQDVSKSAMMTLQKALNTTMWAETLGRENALVASISVQYEELLRQWKKRPHETMEQKMARRRARREIVDAKMKQAKDSVSGTLKAVNSQILSWRTTHFREEQKQLLKLWWKVSGKKAKTKERELKSFFRSWRGRN